MMLGAGLVLVPTGSSEAKCEQTQDPFWATYDGDACDGPAYDCQVWDYECD
jgi:hypothetical protein